MFKNIVSIAYFVVVGTQTAILNAFTIVMPRATNNQGT